jgi:hypothetical protein
MKQKDVFKKIGGIIKELNDQYEYLQTVPDDLNELELELFVSNAHFLTDHIEILNKLNSQTKKTLPPPVEKPEVTYEQKFFEPVVQQMKQATGITEPKLPKEIEKSVDFAITRPEANQPVPQIDLRSGSTEDTYSFIREEPETIRHELILDESENWEDDEYPPEENEITNTFKKSETEPEVMAEVPVATVENEDINLADKKEEVKAAPANSNTAEEVVTINQKMSAQLGDKAAVKTEQLNIVPISDIKAAITLNDKLLYVKDLFNGYNLAYSEAIEILNRFNTFEEAHRFLKTNYVTKNNWESKPATMEKFYALLKRRYA